MAFDTAREVELLVAGGMGKQAAMVYLGGLVDRYPSLGVPPKELPIDFRILGNRVVLGLLDERIYLSTRVRDIVQNKWTLRYGYQGTDRAVYASLVNLHETFQESGIIALVGGSDEQKYRLSQAIVTCALGTDHVRTPCVPVQKLVTKGPLKEFREQMQGIIRTYFRSLSISEDVVNVDAALLVELRKRGYYVDTSALEGQDGDTLGKLATHAASGYDLRTSLGKFVEEEITRMETEAAQIKQTSKN